MSKSTPLTPAISAVITNTTAFVIPPRSIVVATSINTSVATRRQESNTVLSATQYSGQVGDILVTGSAPIAAGGYGRAFYDPFLFVSIDNTVAPPLIGEQWGPIPGQWSIGRGGMGFFCHGFDATNGAPGRALFLRKDGYYFGKLVSTVSAATYGAPTSGQFNVWHPDPTVSGPGQKLIVSPNTALLGLTAYNYSKSLSGTNDYDCLVQMLPQGLTFVSIGCVAS